MALFRSFHFKSLAEFRPLKEDGIKINLENTLSALPLLEKARGAITGFEVAMGDMDDAFMGITGKEIRE